ncbi:MAG: SpoIIE family protein phosphatase [Lachnospiraceae bacterium]|nr:SpoIIE family protein phosphatase [Lachnospiraceae bacterium]
MNLFRRKSLNFKAFWTIFAGAIFLCVLAIFLATLLYAYTIYMTYVNDAVRESDVICSLIRMDDLEMIIDKSKEIFQRRYDSLHWDREGLVVDDTAYRIYLKEMSSLEHYLEYAKIRNVLIGFRENGEYGAITMQSFDPEKQCAYILFDADTDAYRYVPGDILELNYEEYERTGEPFDRVALTNIANNGKAITSNLPIYAKDGKTVLCYLSIDVNVSDIWINILKFLRAFLIILIVVTVLCALGAARLLRRSILVPIMDLSSAARRYTERQNSDLEESGAIFAPLKLRREDEIGDLWKAMNEMEDHIAYSVQEVKKMAAEQERLSTELSIATDIQAQMLPRTFPAFPDRYEFRLYASMNPAKEVGGDFYDFFLVDDDHLALVMADVSGKGVPAALFMVIAKTIIKNITQSGHFKGPGAILAEVNDRLADGNDAMIFVTVWLGILTISTGHIVSANGGHEFPAIYRSGGSFELGKDSHGPGLAVIEGVDFEEFEWDLKKGDKIFLYTDGLPEAADENEEFFGIERMLESLNRHSKKSVEELLKNVYKDVMNFEGNALPFDDLTMLALEYDYEPK